MNYLNNTHNRNLPTPLLTFGLMVLSQLLTFGCEAQPSTGGTKGTLRIHGKTLAEIQITVHHLEGPNPKSIGFGLTKDDGTFELMKTGAKDELWLTPGKYRLTLESIGPPLNLPVEYVHAETSPLVINWSANDETLSLNAP